MLDDNTYGTCSMYAVSGWLANEGRPYLHEVVCVHYHCTFRGDRMFVSGWRQAVFDIKKEYALRNEIREPVG